MLIVLIVILGLTPPVLSLWVMRQANQRTAHQLRAAMNRPTRNSWAGNPQTEPRLMPGLPAGSASGPRQLDLPPADYRYVEGVGYMMGDLSCQFNARSRYLRCAVNPTGDCTTCSHYQSRPLDDEVEG